MSSPLVVGLTGGIASGKSYASDFLRQQGFHVIDTDEVARSVVEKGSATLLQIADYLGSAVLSADGSLNRQAVRELIFNDAERLAGYEAIILPAIRKETLNRLRNAPQSVNFILLVVPLLFEKGLDQVCDATVTIDASREQQMERAMKRSSMTRQTLEGILSQQLSRQQRNLKADYIIDNTGSLAAFEDHLRQFVETLESNQLQR